MESNYAYMAVGFVVGLFVGGFIYASIRKLIDWVFG